MAGKVNRKNQLIAMLKKSGDKGLTSEQIANSFGWKNISSAGKLIKGVRESGINIKYEHGHFKTNGSSSSHTMSPIQKTRPSTNGGMTLRSKVLNAVMLAGARGITLPDISRESGSKETAVASHLNALRREGHKFKYSKKQGLYFYKGQNLRWSTRKYKRREAQVPTFSAAQENVLDILGNKKLTAAARRLDPETLTQDFLPLIRQAYVAIRMAEAIADSGKYIEEIISKIEKGDADGR